MLKDRQSVFAERLTALRNAHGLTQFKFSQSLKVDRSTYAYYETGRTQPSLEVLIRIAKALNVTVDYLLGAQDTSDPYAGEPLTVHSSSIFAQNDEERFDTLNEEEKLLLLSFRQLSEESRQRISQEASDEVDAMLLQESRKKHNSDE